MQIIDEVFEPVTWLTRAQVAAHIGYNPRTLANWAAMDIGPTYTRVGGGRVLYRMADVESWLATQPQKTAS